jgi:hypothetical protein
LFSNVCDDQIQACEQARQELRCNLQMKAAFSIAQKQANSKSKSLLSVIQSMGMSISFLQ